MAAETLTIVLKADGTSLTGTVKLADGTVAELGKTADEVGTKLEALGKKVRGTSADIDSAAASAKKAGTAVAAAGTGINTAASSAKTAQTNFSGLSGSLNTLGGTMGRTVTQLAGLGGSIGSVFSSVASALGGWVTAALAAVALLIKYFVSIREQAKQIAAATGEAFLEAKNSIDAFARAPDIKNLKVFTETQKAIDELNIAVVNGRAKLMREAVLYQEAYNRLGINDDTRFKAAAAELDATMTKERALTSAMTESTAAMQVQFQGLTGLKNLTQQQRQALTELTLAYISGKATETETTQRVAELATQGGNAAEAMRLLRMGFKGAADEAAGFNSIIAGINKNIAQLNIRKAGLQGGTEAEIRRRVGYDIIDKGGPQNMTPAELAATGNAMREEIRLSQQVEQITKEQADARKAATKAIGDQGKAQRDKLRDDHQEQTAIADLNALIRDQESLYGGPLVKAQNAQAEALARIAKDETDLATAGRLDAAAQQLLAQARTTANQAGERAIELATREQAELDRKADLVGESIQQYQDETAALAMSAREHAVQEALLAAETAARDQYNKGLLDSNVLTATQTALIREGIEAGYDQREMQDASAAAAQEYQDSWRNAVDSVSRAFGDWTTGGIKSFEDFGDTLLQIAQRFISDIVAQFAKAKLTQVATSWLSAMGGTQGGTNWASLAMSALGGGGGSSGFSGAGNSSGLIGTIASWFGGGGSATAATGAWAGLGTTSLTGGAASAGTGMWGAFAPSAGAGAAAAGSGGASAGAGASGAAGGAAAAAWVLAILAGMYWGSQLYKGGWREEGGDVGKYEYATPGAHLSLSADELLQKLGVSDKWAAILSGSGSIVRAFGLQAPKVKDQGLVGNIGFGGFEGQAYADIVRKGGWFRSDKKSTEYGELNTGVDQAFDAVAAMMNGRVQDLAKQMGIDINGALSGVKIDIGKLVLDEDPEKAKQQIQDKLDEVTQSLAEAAVRALQFDRLLDDGFQATDVMSALSASIALVTGGADKLGRALTALERENVARGVEYFEKMALQTGQSLPDAVSTIVGNISSYSQLMTDVDSQLKTAGLNEYQQAQLQIELQYRSQVKQANDLAKALGLSGARSEDLAKIEQLRAVSMANLQTQMEAQKNDLLDSLKISDLSPLKDSQKLAETMQQLQAAVAAGDISGVQSLAQTALGYGRSLYASGADYNALYGQVTGLIQGMGVPGLDDTDMGDLADILTSLPEDIATAIFNLLYNPATSIAAPPVTTPVIGPPVQVGGGGGGGGGPLGGGGGKNNHVSTMAKSMAQVVDQLSTLVDHSTESLKEQRTSTLRKLNQKTVKA